MTRRELLERRERRWRDILRDCTESRDTYSADHAEEELALVQTILRVASAQHHIGMDDFLDQPPETT